MNDYNKLEQIISDNKDKIYYYFLKRVNNIHDAEDLTQETFMQAYKSFNNFKNKSKIITWLYAVSNNILKTYYTKKNKNKEVMLNDEVFILDSNCLVYGEIENKNDIIKIIVECVNQLNNKHKEIIVYAIFDKLSYEKISEIINIPVGTVRSRLYNARKELQNKLIKNELFKNLIH